MISGGHCCLYVGAAWPAPPCRLFVHKVRAGELCQTIAWLSYYPHTIEPWDEAEFWGPWFWGPVGGGGRMDGGRGGWMVFPECESRNLGGGWGGGGNQSTSPLGSRSGAAGFSFHVAAGKLLKVLAAEITL